jgi:predicted nucleotidyltransferase
MNRVTEMQIHDPVLGEIVRRLVDDCQPERIYLFGSRARGNAGAGDASTRSPPGQKRV